MKLFFNVAEESLTDGDEREENFKLNVVLANNSHSDRYFRIIHCAAKDVTFKSRSIDNWSKKR